MIFGFPFIYGRRFPHSKNLSNYSISSGSPSHAYHVRRIAYLALNFPKDPIEIGSDYGFPEIVDGNHRACAALIRRDQTVLVDFQDKQSERFLWIERETNRRQNYDDPLSQAR